MTHWRSNLLTVLLAAATAAACSDDAELADPGGMGAGRPDTAGSGEAPAESVLPYGTQSSVTDTSAVVQPDTGRPR